MPHGLQRMNLKSGLLVLCGLMMVADLWLIFQVAPTDAVIGDVQRVFYFHVPLALLSFLAFFVVFVGSIVYLVKRSPAADRIAYSAAEVGVVFVSLALLTGMIWARPVWNTWWTFEPRLTTTLILWFIYVGYLMIGYAAPNRAKGAMYSAVVGIIGFIDVPIVYYSVVWWRSIHPSPVVGPMAEAGALEPVMLNILLFSMLTFLLLFVYLVMERASLRKSEDDSRAIRLALRRSSL